MATRARIGMKLKGTDSIVSVYHHWDGYPEWLGKKLLNKFYTTDAVRSLIDGGDISCVESHRDWDGNELPEPIVLTYADRGDENVEPVFSDNLDEFLKVADDSTANYAYVFDDGFWTCYDVYTQTLVNFG